MQRSYSAFPAGAPGVGLLLLRAAASAAAGLQGWTYVAGPAAGRWTWTAGLLACATAACLLAGFMTPIAACVAAIGRLAVALSLVPPLFGDLPGPSPSTLLISTMMVAVVLLGPGAYSADSRIFGRREVVIQRRPEGTTN